MKLSARDCRYIHDALLGRYIRVEDEKEKAIFCELKKKFEGPNGMGLRGPDRVVEFEESWRNQLAELREKEAEVDEKIKNLHGYYLTFSENSWKFVFGMIQVVLIFSLLGAVLYTIASMPSEWAVWAPIPIAFCLFLWEYSGRCFSGWFWRKR